MVSLSDPAVQSFIFYSCVLAAKVSLMTMLTGRHRLNKNIFPSEEDAKFTKGRVKYDDPDIERVRRAHRNDLENIPVFWVMGALYLTTNPAAVWAQILFKLFTVGRIAHTFTYAIMPMQPARGIAFSISYFINCYMVFHVVTYYIGAM